MGLVRVNANLDNDDWKWFQDQGKEIYQTGLGGGSALLRKVMSEYRAKTEKKESKPAVHQVMPEQIAGHLPLKGGKSWPVTYDYIGQLQGTYPGIDVGQQLNAMHGWLDANPAKRKTAGGMKRFITSWLNRAKERGGNAQVTNWDEGMENLL